MTEILIVAGIALVVTLVGSIWGPGIYRAPSPRNILFKKSGHLLTREELDLYRVLQEIAMPHDWFVFPKVRLEEVVDFAPHIKPSKAVRARLKLSAADFLICDSRGMQPIVVIASGQFNSQQNILVRDMLAQAGVPFLQVPASDAYDQDDIASRINIVTGE